MYKTFNGINYQPQLVLAGYQGYLEFMNIPFPFQASPRYKKNPTLKRSALDSETFSQHEDYLHSRSLISHLKMDGWKTTFLLGWYIFRGELLNFQGGITCEVRKCEFGWPNLLQHSDVKELQHPCTPVEFCGCTYDLRCMM